MILLNRHLCPDADLVPIAPVSSGFSSLDPLPNSRARQGWLRLNGVALETPALFPVINLLTGPPPLDRNGAVYKFLKDRLIFRDRRPAFISEVLHFADFHLTPTRLREWFPQLDGVSDPETFASWMEKTFR